MARSILGLAVALLLVAPVGAGEFDREFAGKARTPAPAVAKFSQPTAMFSKDLQAGVVGSSEMDKESPALAYRGYRGGYHGGYHGWGGHWGGYHHHYGWGRWGWGGGYWGGYRPFYYARSAFYYPNYAYTYYPSYYLTYSPYGGYCF